MKNNPASLIDPLGLDDRPKHRPTCYDFNCACEYYGCSKFPGYTGYGQDQCVVNGYESVSSCASINGNDIFDAIAGAPGTYLTTDIYGNVGFGFSIDLYNQTWNLIDSERNAFAQLGGNPQGVRTSGFQVTVQSYGNDQYSMWGLVPSLNAIAQSQQQLVAMLPTQFQAQYQGLVQNPNGLDPLAPTLRSFQTQEPAAFNRLVPYINAFVNQQAALAEQLNAFFNSP